MQTIDLTQVIISKFNNTITPEEKNQHKVHVENEIRKKKQLRKTMKDKNQHEQVFGNHHRILQSSQHHD